jgi:anhydro-N-acetylmuramic acid kinase
VGLLSGTSADAIDAVAVRIDGRGDLTDLAALAVPLDAEIQDQILTLQSRSIELHELGELDKRLGEFFGNAAIRLLEENGIDRGKVQAIGSHGQTLLHKPNGEFPFTIQLGDPNTIAERTGVTTVADFRSRDISAGGQGAPLVPLFHQAWLGTMSDTAVLNMGGIANITVLAKEGAEPELGFDTGPANTLIDSWARLHLNKEFDEGGNWAEEGTVHAELLETLLEHPYFERLPQKSVDVSEFGLKWLEGHLAAFSEIPPRDVAATIIELSAKSIALAMSRWAHNTKQVVQRGGSKW